MEFKEHLSKYLTYEEIDSLLNSLDKPNKHAALLNINKIKDDEFISLFPKVTKHPIVPHAYIYEKEIYDLGKSIYYDLGCFYLQEPSAMLVSYLLNPNANDIVLDMCAAPGGKSVQASLLMKGEGVIFSNDLARDRTYILLENIEKLGLRNIVITDNDFQKIEQNYENYFTKIILDAPCSGSAMFRKDKKMMEDWSYNKVLKYSEIQKNLLISAYRMLKPGGMLVYSTCSFSFEEDEENIKHLLDNTDAIEEKIPYSKEFYVSRKLSYGIHLFPNIFSGEGHYICLIRKPPLLNITKSNVENFKIEIEHFDRSKVKVFGDTKFFLNKEIKNVGLNIIRYGVKYSTIKGKDEIFDFHLSRVLDSFMNTLELNENELIKYIAGESLPRISKKGMILLKYNNIPVSFGKSDGKIIKNHYPKHLRKSITI
jgi:NOL1/NOP2/sun family putative RNA methylase